MMEIVYSHNRIPAAEQVIELFDKAKMPRPTGDRERIQKMIDNADLIGTAWAAEKLVGIVRIITDWCWCAYLSDLAVDPGYKQAGIGRNLFQLAKDKLGDETMILLLSVPSAMEYYPKIGFQKEDRAFMFPRSR